SRRESTWTRFLSWRIGMSCSRANSRIFSATKPLPLAVTLGASSRPGRNRNATACKGCLGFSAMSRPRIDQIQVRRNASGPGGELLLFLGRNLVQRFGGQQHLTIAQRLQPFLKAWDLGLKPV